MKNVCLASLSKSMLLTLLSLAVCLIASAQVSFAQQDLDQTFGTGGKVLTDFNLNNSEYIQKILLQPDGKIVAVGYTEHIIDWQSPRPQDPALARYNTDGSLDQTFGTGGRVVADLDGLSVLYDAALQADGKIVVVGKYWSPPGNINPPWDFLVMRYNSNGTLDTSFSGDGITTIGFGLNTDYGYAVVIEPDGKIVVGGTSINGTTSNGSTSVLVLVRYNPDGSLDTSFGPDGYGFAVMYNSYPPSQSGGLSHLLLQPDGKFVSSGYNNGLLTRQNSDGTPDFSFGLSGGMTSPYIGYGGTYIALQPDGKILAGAGFDGNFSVTRFNTDGSVDHTFGNNGRTVTSFTAGTELPYAIAAQADGSFVIGGFAPGPLGQRTNFALARYSANGTLLGRATTDFSHRFDQINSLAIQPDGKIIAAGYSYSTVVNFTLPTDSDFALARYVNLSTINVTHPFDLTGDFISDIAVYRPGATANDPSNWYILRSGYNTLLAVQFGNGEDKIVPADFDGDGPVNIAVWRPSNGTWYTSTDPSINYGAFQWGQSGDIPVPGDFDGDGKADYAVFRPSNGYWYVRRSSDTNLLLQSFGQNGDKPLIGDFDGDGKTDFAYVRIVGNDLSWNILQSSNGATVTQTFGLATDKIVPADYDGDGKTNIAVFRPTTGKWYTSLNPATNYGEVAWGQNGDVPVAADYDNDGKADLAVFRPGNRTWYILRTTDGMLQQQLWGLGTDTPVETAFQQ